MSPTLTQGQNAGRDQKVSPLAIAHGIHPGVSADQNDAMVLSAGLMPCVSYACTTDLLMTSISPNAFELVGIRPERLVGSRTLWEERIFLKIAVG